MGLMNLWCAMGAALAIASCSASSEGDEKADKAKPATAVKASLPSSAGTLVPAAISPGEKSDPFWRNAIVYFLMTDRFADGDPTNNNAYGRKRDGDKLRSFMGGDIEGVIQKLEEGYFKDLSVTAIWTTPVIEQVHQPFDEYGRSYAFHGYWPFDWTRVDAAFGDEAQFAEMVETAHSQGIRIIVDVILNHAGPVTNADPRWPEEWVRAEPACDYKTYAGTAACVIVPALQDIRTESETPADLPAFIVEKWRNEGRLDKELAELDAFFARTDYPRAPKYYLIKWLTDWVRKYGVDGFRVDTAKHVDPEALAALRKEADLAFQEWKAAHPDKILDDRRFYMVGEVFNYGLAGFQNAVAGRPEFDYGDRRVNFFEHGFDALINMGFPTHARQSAAELFQLYAGELNGPLKGKGVLNYIASHDDPAPLDQDRRTPFDDATKLMLAPGGVQIFYGDELARDLTIDGAAGDATLRSFMNWEALETSEGKALLDHWRRLAAFRKAHPAVGAGLHREIQRSPFVFSRVLNEGPVSDAAIVAIADKEPFVSIPVAGIFEDGDLVSDSYRNETIMVERGRVTFASPRTIALLSDAQQQAFRGRRIPEGGCVIGVS